MVERYTERQAATNDDLTYFSPKASAFLRFVATKKNIRPHELVQKKAYGVMLGPDGHSTSPDAGRYTVVIPGDVDLTNFPGGFSGNDLPRWIVVQGDLRVAPAFFATLTFDKTIDVRETLVLASPTKMSTPEQKALLDRVHLVPGLDCRDIRIQLPGEGQDSSIEHATESYVQRLATMKCREFADYLTTHATEYGEHIQDDGWKHGSPNYIYLYLVRRPELRGLPEKDIEKITALSNDAFAAYSGRNNKPGLTDITGVVDVIFTEWERLQQTGKTKIRIENSGTGFMHWIFKSGVRTGETRKKAYITLRNPLDVITPELIRDIVLAIEQTGLDGQFKLTLDANALQARFDNMVIYGNDEASVKVALDAAIQVLRSAGLKGSTNVGEDKDGMSYNELLAKQIKLALRQKRIKNGA